SFAAAVRKAGSVDTEKLIEAFRGLQLESPFGPITYRPEDHQATMGAYVGLTTVRDGKGVMKDFRYVDGASVLPSPEQTRKLRPAER
ncbi:MAG: ABC transporter substrate-binding protein, partial [Burkholderiaceae bacterium]